MERSRVQLKRASVRFEPLDITNAKRVAVLQSFTVVRHEVSRQAQRMARVAALSVNAKSAFVCWVGEASVHLLAAHQLNVDLLPRGLPSQVQVLLPEEAFQSESATHLRMVSGLLQTSQRFAFMAVAPLKHRDGHILGCICVLDVQPLRLSSGQLEVLTLLGDEFIDQMEARLEAYQAKLTTNAPSISERKQIAEQLLEGTDEAIITENMDGVVTFWNAGAERLYGYSAKEALGRNVTFLIPQGNELTAQNFAARVMAGERLPPLEMQRVHKSGFRIHVRAAFNALRDASGKVIGVMSFSGAPGNPQQTTQNLRLQQLMQNIPVFVLQLDHAGVVVDISGKALHDLGFQPQQLIGQSAFHIFLDSPKVVRLLATVLGGEALHTTLEWRNRHFEVWFSPLMQHDQPNGLSALAIDITDQISTRDALEYSESQLFDVLQTLPIVVVRCDEIGTLTLFTGRDVSLEVRQRRVGRNAFEIFASSPQVIGALRRALAGEPVHEVMEWRGTYQEAWISPLFVQDKISGATGIFTDVTAERLKDLELERIRGEVLREQSLTYTVANSISEGLSINDREDKFIYVNPARAAMQGYTTQEMIGMQIEHFLSDAEKMQARAAQSRLYVGEIVRQTRKILHRNGSEMDIEVVMHPQFLDGEYTGSINVISDITAQLQLKRELAAAQLEMEREQRFALDIATSIVQGLFITDALGLVQYANPTQARLHGLDVVAVVGQSFAKFLAQDETLGVVLERLESAEVVRVQQQVVTKEFGHRDLETLLYPRFEAGQFIGVIGISSDITKQLEQQKALDAARCMAEREKNFALTVTQTINQGISVTDADHRIVYVNQARAKMQGVPVSQMIGIDILSLSNASDHQVVLEARARLETGEIFHEIRLLHGAENAELLVDVVSYPRFENGEFAGAVTIMTDITEQHALEHERKITQIITNSVHQGLALLGADGVVEFVNPALAEMMQLPTTELLQMSSHDYFEPTQLPRLEQIWLTQRDGVLNVYETRLASGVPVRVEETPRLDRQRFMGSVIVVTNITAELERQLEMKALLAKLEAERAAAQTVVENLPYAFTFADAKQRFVYVNPMYENLFGYLNTELIGTPIDDTFGVQPEAITTRINEDFKAGKRSLVPLRGNKKNGQTLDVLATITLLSDGGTMATLIPLDTNLRRALELERQLEVVSGQLEYERQQALTITNGILQGIVLLDAKAQVMWVNPAWTEMTGYTLEEARNQTGTFIFHPDDVEKGKKRFIERQNGTSNVYRTRVIRKNGAELVVEVRGSPRFENGIFQGAIILSRDITADVELEQRLVATTDALGREKDFGQVIVSAVSQGLELLDADHKIQFANAARAEMLGYVVEELIGRDNTDFVLPEDATAIRVARQVRQQHNSIARHQYSFIHKDGSVRQIEYTAHPRFEKGVYVGAVGVLTDVTERNVQEELLRVSERQYRELYEYSAAQTRNLILIDKVRSSLLGVLDVQTAIETIVNSISAAFNVSFVSIYLLENDLLVLKHHVNYPSVIECFDLTGDGVMVRVAREGKPILIKDASQISDFKYAFSDVRSEICVPIRYDNQTLGVLNLESLEVGAFSETDMTTMQQIAGYAANIIVRNQALEQQRARELQLSNIVKALPVVMYSIDQNDIVRSLEGQGITPEQRDMVLHRSLNDVRHMLGLPDLAESAKNEGIYQLQASWQNRHWEFWSAPLLQGTQVMGRVGIAIDVSDRKRISHLVHELQEVVQRVQNLDAVTSTAPATTDLEALEQQLMLLKKNLLHSSNIHGLLEDIGGAAALVQMFAITQPKGMIRFEGGCALYLQQGKIVAVQHPKLQARAAVLDVLGLNQGFFRFDPSAVAEKPDLSLDPIAMTLEYTQMLDEGKNKKGRTTQKILPVLPTAQGFIALANIEVALMFMRGVGGETAFVASFEYGTGWQGEKLVLRGTSFTILVLQGTLAELPDSIPRA